MTSLTLMDAAAFSASATCPWAPEPSGERNPMRAARGTTSLSSSSFLPTSDNPGDVATRTCKACHKPGRYRIGAAEHDDRNRCRRIPGRADRVRADWNDSVHLEMHQLTRQRREPVDLVVGMSVFDVEV